MKMKVLQFGMALGVIFALLVFLVGLLNLHVESYGRDFLKMLDSIFPGYVYGKWGFGGVMMATAYSAVDGFLIGIAIAWLYNTLGREKRI